MNDLFSAKTTLYFTVSIDAMLRFLAHGYFFPLYKKIPIQKSFSFGFDNMIVFSEYKNAIISNNNQSKDFVIVEIDIDLFSIPKGKMRKEKELYFITHIFPISMINRIWFIDEEKKDMFYMPPSNFYIEENLFAIDNSISIKIIENVNFKMKYDEQIFLTYKMLSIAYAFFRSYRESDSDFVWLYSDYHILVLNALFHDEAKYEKNDLSKYEDLLSHIFRYYFNEITFDDLINYVSMLHLEHALKDILIFAHLFKYMSLDFGYDSDGRLSIDLQKVWKVYFESLLSNNVFVNWYANDDSNSSYDVLKSRLHGYLNTNNMGFSIRENYDLYYKQSPFFALLPILIKTIATYDLDDIKQNAKNYSNILKIHISLLVSAKAAFNGFPIFNYTFKDRSDYFHYMDLLISKDYKELDERKKSESSFSTNQVVTLTKKGFPLIKSRYSEVDNYKTYFNNLASIHKIASIEKSVKKYLSQSYLRSFYNQLKNIENIQLLFDDNKEMEKALDKLIKARAKAVIKDIQKLNQGKFNSNKREFIALQAFLNKELKK